MSQVLMCMIYLFQSSLIKKCNLSPPVKLLSVDVIKPELSVCDC